MTEKSTLSLVDRFRVQVEHRNLNDRALIEGPLGACGPHGAAIVWILARLTDENVISTPE